MPSASSEYVKDEFLKRHEIVRAGAGAGKTYALTHKVADLALEHQRDHGRLPRMIVTTFTRKATGELRERLMLLALEEKRELTDFVNSRSHLVVSTIHGVMDLYLKRYGTHLCVDPGYKIIGAPEASKLARQVMRQIVLSDETLADLLESYPFNRLVNLARRLDSLRSELPDAKPFGLSDFEIIFRQRASEVAKTLEEAAGRILEETEKENWVQMAEVYRGLSALLTRGNWAVNRPLFISAREEMTPARKPSRGASPVSEATIEFAKFAREEADEFRDSVYDPEAWRALTSDYEVFDELGRRFHDEFRKFKLDQGHLEISDLEHLAMNCIRKHPETAEAFWREWDYWLIDEYQDTSPFQVELLRHLTGESPNFVVGDPQQSIYLFRGARSEVFGERETQILQGGGQRRVLTMNRRSDPELLLFFNEFFTRLEPPFQPMEPFLEEGERIDPLKKVATFFIGSKEEENESELEAIVSHVRSLLEKGTRPEDICVLARTNAALNEIANRLGDAGLPTHVHASSGFYDRREIRDALAFLKFLINPHDNFNTVEVLRSPWFKVPDRTLIPYARKRPESLWSFLLDHLSIQDDGKSVLRLHHLLQMTKTEGLSETFIKGLIEAGFVDLSHTHDVSGRRESNIWKLISRLQQEECKPGFNPLSFISSSRTDIKMDEGNAEGDAVAAVEPDRINLMTVHASKGLEFDHVIVPRMQERPRTTLAEDFTFDEDRGLWAMRVPFGEDHEMMKSLPEVNWLKKFRRQELEEHARVLYVALTRAVKSVFLSWTNPPAKNSWAEMVKFDLTPGVHREDAFTYEVCVNDLARPPGPEIPLKTTEVRSPVRAPFQSGDGKESRAVSVTDLLDEKAGPHFVSGSDAEVSRLLQLASRGSAVHRLMELLKYPSSVGLERLVSKWFPGDEDRVLKAVQFVRACDEPPLVEIIANGEVEWGFVIQEGSIVIEGQIDLWGRTDGGDVWIIDYKTGNPEERAKAFAQMGLYSFALRKSGLVKPEESIRLAAIYPFAKEVYIESEPPPERVRTSLGL